MNDFKRSQSLFTLLLTPVSHRSWIKYKASTCQEISWQKEILGSGLAGKMPGNPFWKEIDRKYNELPG
jgi:hypothetical protein